MRWPSLHSGSEHYTFQSSYIGSAYDYRSTPLAPPELRIIVLCAALPTATRDRTQVRDVLKRRHVLESHCEVIGPGESRAFFYETRWRWDGVRVQGRPRKADGLASNAKNSNYLSQWTQDPRRKPQNRVRPTHNTMAHDHSGHSHRPKVATKSALKRSVPQTK